MLHITQVRFNTIKVVRHHPLVPSLLVAVLHNVQVLVGAFSLLVTEIATVIWEFI